MTTLLSTRETYAHMRVDLERASRVDLMSLQRDPPESGTGSSEKLEYFERLDKIVSSACQGTNNKTIRRLVTVSPGKLQWVRQNLYNSKGNSDYELREIIIGPRSAVWNFQIFDCVSLYIMDPEIAQDNANTFVRHLRIPYVDENAQIFEHFQSTFERYWEGTIPEVFSKRLNLRDSDLPTPRLHQLASMEPYRVLQDRPKDSVVLKLEDMARSEGFENCRTRPDIESAMKKLVRTIKHEESNSLIPYPAEELRARIERGYGAVLFDPSLTKLLSHISLKPIFDNSIARKIDPNLSCLQGAFEVFEMATGWTDKSVRSRGFSSRLRRRILEITQDPNRVFVSFCKGVGASPVLQRLLWRCVPWQEFRFVSCLLGWEEDGKLYKAGIGKMVNSHEAFNQQHCEFDMEKKRDPDYLKRWNQRIYLWTNSVVDLQRVELHLKSVLSLYRREVHGASYCKSEEADLTLWKSMLREGLGQDPMLASTTYS